MRDVVALLAAAMWPIVGSLLIFVLIFAAFWLSHRRVAQGFDFADSSHKKGAPSLRLLQGRVRRC